MKYRLIIQFLITLLVSFCSCGIETTNIDTINTDKFQITAAIVDLDSILDQSKAVLYIRKSLDKISEEIQHDLSIKERQLQEAESKLIEKRGTLPEVEFNKLVTDFNKQVNSTQQKMQNNKQALEIAYAKAMGKVHDTTINIIHDLSKKYGFNIVFQSSQVLFVNNCLNITHEVLSHLNQNLQEVEIEYNPISKK